MAGGESDHRDRQIAGLRPRRRRGRSGGGAPPPSLRRPRRGVQPGHPGGITGRTGPGGRSGRANWESEPSRRRPSTSPPSLPTGPRRACRPATLRAALAAIAFAHRAEGLDSPTEDEGVGATMRGLSRMLGRGQRQAPGLTRDCLAAIRAVACVPRRGRGGRLETPEYARRRGLVDIALASVMRDGLLRRGEAAAATWSDVTWEPDGSGRLLVRRSKTDPEGIGTVLFLSRHYCRGPEGDPSGGLHRRRPGLWAVRAADPPPPAGSCEGGGPRRRVLGPQRPCRDGTGPRGVGNRAARADDGGEVVQPDDAGAVHPGAAGGTRRRGQVLRGVGKGGAAGWGSTTEGQRWPARFSDARI